MVSSWSPPVIHFRFGTNTVDKVLRGEKLATRRPYTDTNVHYFRKMIGRIVRLYEGGKWVHAVVTNVYSQRLGDMTDEDAKLEGFESLEEFKSVWRTIYGGFNPEELVVVIEFVPYGCWRFEPSRKSIEIEGVRAPLCKHRGERKSIDRGCAFCWLLPMEWCGNCVHLEVRGSRRFCRAMGFETEIPRLRLNPHIHRSCEMYRRRVPPVVVKGFEKLRSLGVDEVR